jgi:hypothetical protein
MSCDPPPRSIDDGLDWFLSHTASGSGMCAQHTWHSLGGDRGCPPAWGCANANAVYDKVKKSGRYWTTPRRGDIALWKYGSNGHAARVYDDAGTKIATTNPSSGPSNGTGIEPIGYPAKWGATSSARIFTDTYNGIKCFESTGIDHGEVYLEKLKFGQEDSDSVRRLQLHLNDHPLEDGEELPITGNYGEQTDEEVRLCQAQHGFGSDPVGSSSVGPNQAAHLFTNCDCIVIDDSEGEELPPPTTEVPVSDDYWYSGKPAGELKFSGSYKKLDVSTYKPPRDGVLMGMLYANVDGEGEIRVRLIRDPDDATAYQTYYVKAGDNCLITHVWFEACEKGRPLWWEFCSMDGTTHTVTTRYAKFAMVA